ncbi:STAS domain-containing protein [Streptomyces somaliensis]|nr:STAS domain-containing protein [Streptomyces somaliensis]
MSDETEVLVSTAAGVRIMRVGGEFDFGTAEDLDRALTPDPRGAAAGTVLDLSRVAFADSSFLHVLLRAEERHRAAGVPLLPTRPSPPVVRLLEITDSARSLTFLDSVTAAARAASARRRGRTAGTDRAAAGGRTGTTGRGRERRRRTGRPTIPRRAVRTAPPPRRRRVTTYAASSPPGPPAVRDGGRRRPAGDLRTRHRRPRARRWRQPLPRLARRARRPHQRHRPLTGPAARRSPRGRRHP